MNVLITGVLGMVGSHMLDFLLEKPTIKINGTCITISGLNPKITWDDSKPTTIPFRAVSTRRINTELGFTPTHTFEQGIKETIEWYQKYG